MDLLLQTLLYYSKRQCVPIWSAFWLAEAGHRWYNSDLLSLIRLFEWSLHHVCGRWPRVVKQHSHWLIHGWYMVVSACSTIGPSCWISNIVCVARQHNIKIVDFLIYRLGCAEFLQARRRYVQRSVSPSYSLWWTTCVVPISELICGNPIRLLRNLPVQLGGNSNGLSIAFYWRNPLKHCRLLFIV